MLTEEYDAIACFLTQDVYPTSILQSKITSHAKKNFRVKALQYVIGEENKLFKVIVQIYFPLIDEHNDPSNFTLCPY